MGLSESRLSSFLPSGIVNRSLVPGRSHGEISGRIRHVAFENGIGEAAV